MIDENQNPDGNTFYARNVGFMTDNIERERTNGQLVTQYAPV
ncbi:hypothetical protein [Shewanella sp. KX20019]|nr:hypothetical protein [Shewanella sp. KX20019]